MSVSSAIETHFLDWLINSLSRLTGLFFCLSCKYFLFIFQTNVMSMHSPYWSICRHLFSFSSVENKEISSMIALTSYVSFSNLFSLFDDQWLNEAEHNIHSSLIILDRCQVIRRNMKYLLGVIFLFIQTSHSLELSKYWPDWNKMIKDEILFREIINLSNSIRNAIRCHFRFGDFGFE